MIVKCELREINYLQDLQLAMRRAGQNPTDVEVQIVTFLSFQGKSLKICLDYPINIICASLCMQPGTRYGEQD